jgi:hypothetical protein
MVLAGRAETAARLGEPQALTLAQALVQPFEDVLAQASAYLEGSGH